MLNKRDNNGSVLWECQCDCGNKCIKSSAYLKHHVKTPNCGCVKENKRRWLVGRKIGKLTVLDRNTDGDWLCQCECGNTIIKTTDALKRRKAENLSCLDCQMNVYDLSGEYGICYAYNNKKQILFDKEDYDKIKKFKWSIGTNGYVQTARPKIDGYNHKGLLLHRLIMDIVFNDDVVIDHINRNPLDNRKENLRITDNAHNLRNNSLPKNNTTGVIGVEYVKKTKNWASSITYNNIKYNLGKYKNKDNAIMFRLKAEQRLFKDFAPQKHLFEKYEIDKISDDYIDMVIYNKNVNKINIEHNKTINIFK